MNLKWFLNIFIGKWPLCSNSAMGWLLSECFYSKEPGESIKYSTHVKLDHAYIFVLSVAVGFFLWSLEHFFDATWLTSIKTLCVFIYISFYKINRKLIHSMYCLGFSCYCMIRFCSCYFALEYRTDLHATLFLAPHACSMILFIKNWHDCYVCPKLSGGFLEIMDTMTKFQ